MVNFRIQTYSRDMKELISEFEKEYEEVGTALLEACSMAYHDRIIVLWVDSKHDYGRYRLIAKFY